MWKINGGRRFHSNQKNLASWLALIMQATENLWESPFWPDRRFAEKMKKPAGQMNVDPEQDKCTAIDYGASP